MNSVLLNEPFNSLLCQFQEAFDLHDWDLLTSCLAEQIYTDYSSFRGTPAAWVARDSYIAMRQSALTSLRMQHNFSNLRVTLNGNTATGRCNYAIYRFPSTSTSQPDNFFHSYGHYLFDFIKEVDGWKIAGITQVLLANQGDPTLHAGAK
jgi:hypothetical protein